jgi:hypothetical protein
MMNNVISGLVKEIVSEQGIELTSSQTPHKKRKVKTAAPQS